MLTRAALTTTVEHARSQPGRGDVEQGLVDEQAIVFDRPEIVVGRRQGGDVVIHDTNVSRRHARIVCMRDRLLIEGTGSLNGTLVNDEQIEGQRALRAGDVIRIGDAVFLVKKTEPLLQSLEGATMATDMESPMTSLGSAPELVPPELISGPPGPAGPLTPPPIMDQRGIAVYEELHVLHDAARQAATARSDRSVDRASGPRVRADSIHFTVGAPSIVQAGNPRPG